MLLDLPGDGARKDLATTRSMQAAAVEILAKSIIENDPASPCYQVGITWRAVYRGDHEIHVHQSLVALASPGSQGKSKSIFKALCYGLKAREFLHAALGSFVSVLCEV